MIAEHCPDCAGPLIYGGNVVHCPMCGYLRTFGEEVAPRAKVRPSANKAKLRKRKALR